VVLFINFAVKKKLGIEFIKQNAENTPSTTNIRNRGIEELVS
jgi:hypothetical protein